MTTIFHFFALVFYGVGIWVAFFSLWWLAKNWMFTLGLVIVLLTAVLQPRASTPLQSPRPFQDFRVDNRQLPMGHSLRRWI
jgi:hypothetical protein